MALIVRCGPVLQLQVAGIKRPIRPDTVVEWAAYSQQLAVGVRAHTERSTPSLYLRRCLGFTGWLPSRSDFYACFGSADGYSRSRWRTAHSPTATQCGR